MDLMPRHPIRSAPLFRALLKHWRGARGMSQLDLAVAADVSGRHISFLETGRAEPSREMVLRLGATLGLDLRDQNELLAAAGLPEVYPESPLDGELAPSVERVLSRMLEQQEPYPMVVMNRHYDVIRANRAAADFTLRFVADPTALGETVNAMRGVFDPRLMRPFIVDWPRLARDLLSRLQREALGRPQDDGLRTLINEVLRYPDVPEDWREPDLAGDSFPAVTAAVARDGIRLEFLTTMTVFNAPCDVTVQELKLESYFPADPETEALCKRFAETAPAAR